MTANIKLKTIFLDLFIDLRCLLLSANKYDMEEPAHSGRL